MNTEEMVSYFARFLVALSWFDRTPGPRADANDGEGTPMFTSSFIVEISGKWWLMTAGHILRDIETAIGGNGQKLENFQLHDGLSADSVHTQPQSAALEIAGKKHAYWCADDGIVSGADYGLIALGPLTEAGLRSNGKFAITQMGWETDMPDEFDVYLMLGLPSKLQSVKVFQSSIAVELSPAIITLKKINDPPAHMLKAIPRFYGRIANDLHDEDGNLLRDIDGMSGGPIFGIKRVGDQVRVWLIGIQSCWDEPSRTIAACFAKPLAQELLKATRDRKRPPR